MSRTFLALLHYNGAAFVGWQRQAAGRSVQGEFERALESLCRRHVAAHGAGRTDAGVHAVGLGVSFVAPDKWTAAALRRGLNALLPRDCWVKAVREMSAGFHARRSALGRRYRYDIGTDDGALSPFRRPFEWPLARTLDVATLRSAAVVVRGEHDFRAFAAKGEPKPHHRCEVRLAEWETRDSGRGVSFHVAADRFLHHMVRFLVGTMVDIALGRRPLDDMRVLLGRRDNQATSPPAPPQGLYFVAAEYPADLYLAPLAPDT